jgi:hypothetical protein
MSNIIFSLPESYWEEFKLQEKDIEFLYNLLLERETPLPTRTLVQELVNERITREKEAIQHNRAALGEIYQPKGTYQVDQSLVFPAFNWQPARVLANRPGQNPEIGEFQVIQVAFENGDKREFASSLADHALNQPPKIDDGDVSLDKNIVIEDFGELLVDILDEELEQIEDFVRIAGNWYPRALLVDVGLGHLNLAEAVLDMSGGGPLSTAQLLEQIELTSDVNPSLLEFSLDHALEMDGRFDEVGPAGKILWYLNRLEPAEVLEPPIYLRYPGIEYDRHVLTKAMQDMERTLDDELSPVQVKVPPGDEADVCLIYPHWRAGTLPLSSRLRHLFPTAYEAPRIRFLLVDGDTGESFPGWVVREKRYVYGLKKWYETRGIMPGSLVHVQRSKKAGEVILKIAHRRANREWMRTVLVGSDGGIVFAMLKQYVTAPFDDRMAIAIPHVEAIDPIWVHPNRDNHPLDRLVAQMVRDLAKLSPQGHVHISELYAAINVMRRCPPGPILAVLASNPTFTHVGDLHFRMADSD